jgi:hypothetical protein
MLGEYCCSRKNKTSHVNETITVNGLHVMEKEVEAPLIFCPVPIVVVFFVLAGYISATRDK